MQNSVDTGQLIKSILTTTTDGCSPWTMPMELNHRGHDSRIHFTSRCPNTDDVQERHNSSDRSHSNQNTNWIRSCHQTEKIARIAVLVLLHRFCCSVVVAWVVGGGTAQTILPSQYVMMFPGPSNRHSLTGWLAATGSPLSISYWMMRYETWWMMTTTHDCKNAHDTVAACLRLQRGLNVNWMWLWALWLLLLHARTYYTRHDDTQRERPIKMSWRCSIQYI